MSTGSSRVSRHRMCRLVSGMSLEPFEFRRCHLVSPGVRGVTRCLLVSELSPGVAWCRLVSPGVTLCHLVSPGVDWRQGCRSLSPGQRCRAAAVGGGSWVHGSVWPRVGPLLRVGHPSPPVTRGRPGLLAAPVVLIWSAVDHPGPCADSGRRILPIVMPE